MHEFEALMAEALDDGVISEVLRPSAVLPEDAARLVLVELALRDINASGNWHATPSLWRRFDRPLSLDEPVPLETHLVGTLQVAYGTPTRYEITIYRATITALGTQQGWTVESLCDEALGFGGYTLASCPRASLAPPPRPFRF